MPFEKQKEFRRSMLSLKDFLEQNEKRIEKYKKEEEFTKKYLSLSTRGKKLISFFSRNKNRQVNIQDIAALLNIPASHCYRYTKELRDKGFEIKAFGYHQGYIL